MRQQPSNRIEYEGNTAFTPPQLGGLSGTVLVTGGGRGIGRASAIRLAELGYDVILTWHSSYGLVNDVVEEIQTQGRRACAFQLRLEEDDVAGKFVQIDNWLNKPLVGLVNNAAIHSERVFFLQKNKQDWEDLFQVNVFGVVELCKAAFKRMALSEGGAGGSIVNLSSQVATFGGNHLLAYATSKGAINALTISLAKEVGSEGIRVNAVSPGLIETEGNITPSEQLESKIGQIPLGRLGTPRDVGELIAWLISPLSSFISGTIIPVHGGR